MAPEDTLGEAAERMAEQGVGSAVVLDSGRLIGILTERDLLKAVAGRVHTSEARVREWMTADPITASETDSADEAIRTMLDNGFSASARRRRRQDRGRGQPARADAGRTAGRRLADGNPGSGYVDPALEELRRDQAAAPSQSPARVPINGASGRREGRCSMSKKNSRLARRKTSTRNSSILPAA